MKLMRKTYKYRADVIHICKDFNATYQCYRTISQTCSGICDFLMTFYKINKYMDYLTWTRHHKYHNISITLTGFQPA